MILVDTSAWIEFLRGTGSPVCDAVDRLLTDDHATCDVISMELLAGARDEQQLTQLRGLLARTSVHNFKLTCSSSRRTRRRCRLWIAARAIATASE